MTLSLTSLRNGVLRGTATSVDDWVGGNSDIDEFINRSWWDIAEAFDFREKEAAIIAFTTAPSTRQYDIPATISPNVLDSVERISIEDPISFEHEDLILISDFDYENEYINKSTEESKPTNYFRRGSNIYLYPTPDQVYTLNMYYQKTLGDIISDGPPIPQEWHEIIQYGAVYRALLDLRDYDSAEKILMIQSNAINKRSPVKAKELSDTKHAGVSVLGREY